MRELIIKRIGELFEIEPASPLSTGRWQSCWFKPDLVQFGKPSKKEIALHSLTHISQLNWSTMTNEELISMFELVVMKVYRQYG
jgi:hypothetical protein